jgi:hypothetical protein
MKTFFTILVTFFMLAYIAEAKGNAPRWAEQPVITKDTRKEWVVVDYATDNFMVALAIDGKTVIVRTPHGTQTKECPTRREAQRMFEMQKAYWWAEIK